MPGENVYVRYELTDHIIRSKHVEEEFKIRVARPIAKADGSERFPVLYVTDADLYFGGLADASTHLQVSGETPRFILVGIGYSRSNAAPLLRWRDLVTHDIRRLFEAEVQSIADSEIFSGGVELPVVTKTTDAEQFLEFIRDELIPFVDASYPVAQGDNNFFGYSAGATFGLYVLLKQQHLFRRYIFGSPATAHRGAQFALDLVKYYSNAKEAPRAAVFLGVGEFEGPTDDESISCNRVSDCCLLAEHLAAEKSRGLELTLRVFPGETHATAWAPAFQHGTKALFGPASVAFWNG